MVKVIGSVFKGPGKEGDFAWMIEWPGYQDSLFVFNDNEQSFRKHQEWLRDGGEPCIHRGGGNAIIRPYQAPPPRAAGIPTGPDFDCLNAWRSSLIDLAIDHIGRVVAQHGYKRIYYSAADDSGRLGTAIFDVGEDVKEYIVRRLKTLSTREL